MTIIQAQPLRTYGIFGPASSTDNEVPVFDGVTGKKIKAGSGLINPSAGRLDLLEVRAKDDNGLKLYDDGGSGIFIADGGNVTIGKDLTVTGVNSIIEDGTANGQMAFWDSSSEKWVKAETSELFWDDVNKRLGVGGSPGAKLDVQGTGLKGCLKLKEVGSPYNNTRFFFEKPSATDKINMQITDSGTFKFRYGWSGADYDPFVICGMDGNPRLQFKNSSSEYFRVASAGANSFLNSGKFVFGGTTPATSAQVDIQSTTGALLLPRMTTTQRENLTAVNGMLIYDSTLNQTQTYENGAWRQI